MSQLTDLAIGPLLSAYRRGITTPREVLAQVRARGMAYTGRNIWIYQLSDAELEPYLKELARQSPDPTADNYKPLYGVPFAIKDNIDLAGVPTTAACPAFAYTPDQSASVVAQLVAAGAIPVGKTNLDQFATGLVGTHSPWGAVGNSFDESYISGGSSSGSAVAVALGLVSFALGTDTAGSGRVPAAFNNLIGLKPSKGLLSTRGVVPACRSLDAVSIFALSAGDASQVFASCSDFDGEDIYARAPPDSARGFNISQFRFGVPSPEQREFFGNNEGRALFEQSIANLQAIGGEAVEIDYDVFGQAARLLYEGPWLSERYIAVETLIESNPEALLPITRDIIAAGEQGSAVDTFKAEYQLAELRRRAESVWQSIEVLLLPTAGCCYRIDEVNNDPIQLNTNLGYYTNFVNLLDLCAVAVPAGFQQNGLPFGISLIAPTFTEHALLALAARLHRCSTKSAGATQLPLTTDNDLAPLPAGWVRVAVCGAHLSGLPLNSQLTERGGWLLESTLTAPVYKLYALPGGPPKKPGLIRVAEGGQAIEVEVWAMPLSGYGSFVAGIPAPLGIGTLELCDGTTVQGFLCESVIVDAAKDITRYGGWRAYLASL